MWLRKPLAVLLLLSLAVCPAPLLAQWTWGAPPELLFTAERFAELERDYARVLTARSRNHWGEFHTEEFLRRLHLSLTGASPPEIPKPAAADLDARTQAWLRHSPHSPIAAIARANSLLLRAETAFKAGRWNEGEALSHEARSVLQEVRGEAAPSDPTWHAAWLYVGKQQGWSPKQVMAAVEEATQAEPRAKGPWQVAVAALSPDGSDAGLIRPLAELAVRKTKASEGWSLLATIYLAAARTYGAVHKDPFNRGGLDWSTMNMALSDLHARYPNETVLNQHAVLACLAGDKPVLAALLARIGSNPDRSWWEYWGGPPLLDRCREWARSGTI